MHPLLIYARAVANLKPNAKFSFLAPNYEGLNWQDETDKPTEAEVEAEVARLQAEYDANAYKAKRAAEYPPIGDQLDALWKGGAEAEAMLAKVQAIKNKYPKGV